MRSSQEAVVLFLVDEPSRRAIAADAFLQSSSPVQATATESLTTTIKIKKSGSSTTCSSSLRSLSHQADRRAFNERNRQ